MSMMQMTPVPCNRIIHQHLITERFQIKQVCLIILMDWQLISTQELILMLQMVVRIFLLKMEQNMQNGM